MTERHSKNWIPMLKCQRTTHQEILKTMMHLDFFISFLSFLLSYILFTVCEASRENPWPSRTLHRWASDHLGSWLPATFWQVIKRVLTQPSCLILKIQESKKVASLCLLLGRMTERGNRENVHRMVKLPVVILLFAFCSLLHPSTLWKVYFVSDFRSGTKML